MKAKTLAAVSLVLVTMLIYPVIAQSTTMSIEDAQVAPGGSKTVPIYVYNVTDPDGVGTVELNLTYNSSVVHITGTDTSNSDLDLVIPHWNNSVGVLTLGGSYFEVKPLPTGDVRVIDVTLTAVGSAGDESPLNITDTLLADFTPQANAIPHDVDNGIFRITETPHTVYFTPSHSSAGYGHTTEVEIRANATNFQGGQIKITYNSSCANVTDWERNTATFPIGEWDLSVPGQEWITFTDTGPFTGDYQIGTLTIRCICDCECTTPLDFSTPSALFEPSGDEILANWVDGYFECGKEMCGDVAPYPIGNRQVNMGDVIRLLNYVNSPGEYPVDEWAGNVNCEGEIDMGDVVLLLNNVSYQGQYPLNCCQ
ncbi:MAG: cohesin domain-containing protein [Halobacteriota archaeon]